VFFSRYSTNSELLHLLDLYVMIPKAVIMEVSAKRFFLYSYCAPDTILQVLQMSETQKIKR